MKYIIFTFCLFFIFNSYSQIEKNTGLLKEYAEFLQLQSTTQKIEKDIINNFLREKKGSLIELQNFIAMQKNIYEKLNIYSKISDTLYKHFYEIKCNYMADQIYSAKAFILKCKNHYNEERAVKLKSLINKMQNAENLEEGNKAILFAANLMDECNLILKTFYETNDVPSIIENIDKTLILGYCYEK